MFTWLQNLWNKASLTLQGWKVRVTAVALILFNSYDLFAPYLDWKTLIDNPKTAAVVNAVLGVLVIIFRQMSTTSNNIANSLAQPAKTDSTADNS